MIPARNSVPLAISTVSFLFCSSYSIFHFAYFLSVEAIFFLVDEAWYRQERRIFDVFGLLLTFVIFLFRIAPSFIRLTHL